VFAGNSDSDSGYTAASAQYSAVVTDMVFKESYGPLSPTYLSDFVFRSLTLTASTHRVVRLKACFLVRDVMIGQSARDRPVVSFRVRSCQEATNDSFEVPGHSGNSEERDNKEHLSLIKGQTWCEMREGGEPIP
jgi:hypothetical protein